MRRTIAAAVAVFGLTCIAIWHGSPDGDVVELGRYGHAVIDGQVPYRDFSLEYPPGGLPLFALAALGEGVDGPAHHGHGHDGPPSPRRGVDESQPRP